ncbi:hypothetical protein [Algirhabdus cladophorae]|uniref:hypothetical protein n=1 Tax=Algirhabdus cladophorae TaxID=3377108 RepID=UPI003B847238
MIGFGFSNVGAQSEGSAPPPVATLSLESQTDGTVHIVAQSDTEISLTVSGSTFHDGTYVIDPAAVALGPVNLVPPMLLGDAEVGAVLTAVPGLFVFDAQGDVPVETFVWQKDGVMFQDGTSATYEVAPDDAGVEIRLQHILGAVSVVSEAVMPAISGASFTDDFNAYADEALLQDQPNWSWSYAAGGVIVIRNGRAVSYDASASNIVVPTVPDLTVDHFAEVDAHTIGSGNGAIIEIYVRYTDRFNGYSLRVQNGIGYVTKYLLGVSTIISPQNFTAVDGDILRFQASGDTLTVMQNSVSIMTITDSDITDGTVAMKVRTINSLPPNAPEVDRFSCGDI